MDFRGGDTNLYGYVLNDPVNFVDGAGLHGEKNPIDAIISIWNQKNRIGNDIVTAAENAHPLLQSAMILNATMFAVPVICEGAATATNYAITNPKNTIDFIDGFTNKKSDNKAKFIGRTTREIVEGVFQ